MSRWCSCAVLVASVLAAKPSRADDDDPDGGDPRWTRALVETAIALGVPGIYYWAEPISEDEHHQPRPSWGKKFAFEAWRFDTDPWETNAVRHPVMGIVQYQIGRTNQFGLLGSVALSAAASVFWEYFIEHSEYPSINDVVITTATGVEIGEPLWQIGQLWRGGEVTVGDRVASALFSPIDTIHDLAQGGAPRSRPRAWRSIVLEAGGLHRDLEHDGSRNDAVLSGDIDLVSDRHYLAPGASAGAIAPGSWSRIRGRLRPGDAGTQLLSRTAITGEYEQDDGGTGSLLALGTAFTYHRDRLELSWDHVAIAHLLGPQVQISHRSPDLAVRWDLAAYADFALIDAYVFGGSPPFPRPPPYISSLQAHGYYEGAGASADTRLRVDTPELSLDAEVDGHRIWQINGGDRIAVDTGAPVPLTAHGVSDWRLYWRVELAYHVDDQWGFAAIAEGADRSGSWRGLSRQGSEVAIGGVVRLDL